MLTYIIVDDEHLVRKGTIKKISKLTLDVTCVGEASNGKEAIELIQITNPDIIITDMNMPIMDGSALLDYLTTHYQDKSIIVISGYKDFNYAKKALDSNAINYILKPFSRDDINDAMALAIKRISEKTFNERRLLESEEEKESVRLDYDLKLLKNIILGYAEDSDMFTSLKMSFLSTNHSYILLAFYCYPQTELADFKILIESYNFDNNTICLSSPTSSSLFFILYFIPESLGNTTLKEGQNRIKTTFSVVQSEAPLFYFAGISAPFSNIYSLNKAYQECLSAINNRVLATPQLFYEYSNTQISNADFSWPRLDEFIFRIETGDTQSVEDLTDELFNYLKNQTGSTLHDVKVYCYQVSNRIRHLMTDYFENVNPSTTSSSIQNILETLFTIDELRIYFKQFLVNIAEILKDNSIYNSDDTIDKIILYIEKNYNKNLTVEFVSSLFYLNRSYLSHMFKQKSGSKFVDYVNKVRVEQAKVQLATTSKMMYQIAKSVGYDNVKYFFRIFKKIEGITPKQFQSSIVSKQNGE